MDGAMTKVPLGGEKSDPNSTDRGKSGVKRSLLTEGHGVPIGLTIAGANRHDMKLVRPTIESIIIDRPEPTEEHPQGMCLDKDTTTTRCATSCVSSALRPISAHEEKKPKRSSEKRASKGDAGWWNGVIRG